MGTMIWWFPGFIWFVSRFLPQCAWAYKKCGEGDVFSYDNSGRFSVYDGIQLEQKKKVDFMLRFYFGSGLSIWIILKPVIFHQACFSFVGLG